MIAQRILHGMHTAAEVTQLFDQELARLLADPASVNEAALLREARGQSEDMIRYSFHDPI
jgi:hypothetical protein